MLLKDTDCVFLTCILVSCVPFEHRNAQTKKGLNHVPQVSRFGRIVCLRTVFGLERVLSIHFKKLTQSVNVGVVLVIVSSSANNMERRAFVNKILSDLFFSSTHTKSPNSSFLKWALRCRRGISVFPCSGYPACKGGLEGLRLTPETQPRCWKEAK